MGALVAWWLVVEVVGLLGLPLVFRLFSARADHGYAFAKILTLLLVSYVSWLLTHLGVLAFHLSLPITLGIYVALNGWLAGQDRAALIEWLRGPGRRAIMLHEAVWTAGFLFFAWQRSLAPEIFGAEKYMDFAFFNALTRTDVFPPEDPWMSGNTFNYYYFGYLMFANLARLSPLPNNIAYNLCVVTVAGLAFSQMASIGLLLTRRVGFALMTGAATMLIGNLDGFLQLWEKGGFTKFDYWRSSRIVDKGDTINEFPYFTAIHGDLHPHYIVMLVTILLLALLLDPDRLHRFGEDGLARTVRQHLHYLPIAFVLGSMVVISPWELPVGAMVTFLLLQRRLPPWPLISWPRLRLGVTVIVLLGLAYVLYLPFYLHFAAPPGGVGFKFARTSLVQFLIVFGALLLPGAIFLAGELAGKLALTREQGQLLGAAGLLATIVGYMAGNAVYVVLIGVGGAALVSTYATGEEDHRGPLLLLVTAAIALLACELVYLKDPYGERLYRMNTVFKLYFQSWLMLAIAAPWCWAQLVKRYSPGSGLAGAAVVVGTAVLFVASCAYPVGITATRLTGRVAPTTLDGTEYLTREHPDDFAAIHWMWAHVPGLPVILEATGNPYSYYARFSSNTGLPTVMGWANHEGLWRGHEQEVGRRVTDVGRIYSAATLDEVAGLLDRYRIQYIVVGEIERKDYQGSSLQKFATLPVAFSAGVTTIYRR